MAKKVKSGSSNSRRVKGDNSPTIDWERNPGFLIHDVRRLVVQAVNAGIQGFDLTSAQLQMIFHLARQDKISQVVLAESMGMKKAATGVLVTRLEEKGLVRRHADTVDRRVNEILLTPKARRLLGPIMDSGYDILKDLMSGIEKEEEELLIDLLLRIKSNAQRMIGANSA